MKLIAELEPTRNREKLIRLARLLGEYADAIDIPESPMGRPIAHAALLAAVLRHILREHEIIPHLRVGDVNVVAFKSIMGGLVAAEIGSVVLLRGDPPVEGEFVDQLTVEKAAAEAKTLKKHPSIGAMISLRYPQNKILERLEAPIDFYLVLRAAGNLEKLEWLSREAKRRGKKLYPYIIVGGDENIEILRKMLGGQPVYHVKEAPEAIESIAPYVDGFIVSSPGSPATISMLLKALHRKL